MARRKNSPKPTTVNWDELLAQAWRALTGPLGQQVFAVGLVVLALLTVLPLLRITSGRWTDAWVHALQFLFGWGIIPVACGIGTAGVLILLHHLDQPISWRWRPLVGLETIFFSLLALTHLIAGRANPWALVESGWGGGLFGWALAHLLSLYLGPWIAGLLFFAAMLVGIGLLFDLTVRDVINWLQDLRHLAPTRLTPTPPLRTAHEQPPPPTAGPARPTPATPPTTPPARQPAPTSSRPPTAPPKPAARPIPTPAPSAPAPARPSAAPPPSSPPQPIPFSAMPMPQNLQHPPIDMLAQAESPGLSDEEVRDKSRIIVDTLAQFGLPAQVVEVRRGPAVTQFGVAPGFTDRAASDGQRRPHKVRVSQIASLADDLSLALAAPSLRVEAPVPGRSVVGVEVPNDEIGLVTLRGVMETKEFQALKAPLAIALGEDVAGSPVVADLGQMPHLLVAGTTGSGKSICIKAIATCLAMTNRPDELRLVMIDPKMVELVRFNGLPHLLGHTEVELERIVRVLRWVAHEMDQRYKKFAAVGARNLNDYNQKVARQQPPERLPRILVLIDELADLMMLAPDETERVICRIAQMARATGIHLLVATQRPSTDVVTGLIKANFPARISFVTASQVDSRVILDMPGAETLLGRGDMLYLASDAGHPVRVQGCFVSEPEIERVVDFWRQQMPTWSAEAPWEQMVQGSAPLAGQTPEDEDDGLLEQAVEIVKRHKAVSASYLQRRLRIGYPRAARLMEQLEELGLVGPPESAGRPRRVIGGE